MISSIQLKAWHDLCHNISSYFTKVLHGSSSFVTTAADGEPCTNQSRILHWTHWTNQACHLGLLWDKSSWATPFGEQKLGRLILLDLISARNHIINSNFRSVFWWDYIINHHLGWEWFHDFSQLSGRSLLTLVALDGLLKFLVSNLVERLKSALVLGSLKVTNIWTYDSRSMISWQVGKWKDRKSTYIISHLTNCYKNS